MKNNIPKSWSIQKIGNISKVKGGKRLPKGEKFSDQLTQYPYLRVTDFINGSIDESDLRYLTPEIFEKISRYTIDHKDLYISIAGTIGLVGKIPHHLDGANLTENAAKICNMSEVDQDYLIYYLNSFYGQYQIKSLTGKTSQPKLALGRIEKIEVPVPPLLEQRGIVEVLGTVDECIRLTDAVIERAEELKRGLMQQLLTKGIEHTEYKETTLGAIPKTWKIMKLGEIANTASGGTPSRKNPDFYTGNIPWIKSGELNSGEIFQTEECITDEALKKSSAKMVPKNTLLIAMYGATAGQLAITRIDASINQAIASIMPKIDHAITLFLFYSLQFYSKRIISRTQGSGQPNLSQTVLKNIEIALPPLNEQKQIVTILAAIDEKIKNETRIKEKLFETKQGLMQLLLPGKIRVELKGDGLHRIGDSREANN